jgi:hemerythrin-like metal-binding protein
MTAEWSPELTLNHEELDRQHVELFRRVAEAAAALPGDRAVLEAAVSALAAGLVEHRVTEERIMEEERYPERVRHRSAHELFLADVDRMRADLAAHGPTPQVADWLERRLPEWLGFHVRVNDLPLGEYLARRRPQPDPRARTAQGRRLS